MSNDKTNSGPAFPHEKEVPDHGYSRDMEAKNWRRITVAGMSLRQYAAIKLRIPDSGEEWLDEMIRKSLRDEFAGKAMEGILAFPGKVQQDAAKTPEAVSRLAYEYAGFLLKAREQ